MNFRTDINGLRAFAVVAVVIFHFNASFLPGGFAGVDVFFVISGFLMTKIIFKGIESNTFSYIKFLGSRINRIMPALVVLCLILLVFGWFHLSPNYFKELGLHVASSVSFTSNILYWLQMGYFSASANEKWLLHTWSLSAEWQFYLIYPLLLLAIKKVFPISSIRFLILSIAIISFVFGLYFSSAYPDASYYLLPSRAWEMLAGGIVFLFPISIRQSQKRGLFWLGVLFVLGSYILANEDVLWPSWYTLFPVLGTCAILLSERNDSLLLNNIATQKIGSWSYSIYLWHWPVVVLFNYLNWNTLLSFFVGLMASVVFGALSYEFVEKNRVFQKNSTHWREVFKLPALYSSFVMVILGGSIYASNGVSSRGFLYSSDTLKYITMPNITNGYCFSDFNESKTIDLLKSSKGNCLLGGKGNVPKTLLFGDSFAGHYEPFLDELFKEQGRTLYSLTTNWCHPSLTDDFMGPNNHPSHKQCIKNREYISNNLSNFNTIIISGMWLNISNEGYFKDVLAFIKLAADKGRNIVILPSPKLYSTNIARRYESSLFSSLFDFNIEGYGSELDVTVINLHSEIETLSKQYKNILFISRDDLFNDSGVFYLDDKAVPYSLDSAHISTIGSLNLLPKFRQTKRYEKVIKIISGTSGNSRDHKSLANGL